MASGEPLTLVRQAQLTLQELDLRLRTVVLVLKVLQAGHPVEWEGRILKAITAANLAHLLEAALKPDWNHRPWETMGAILEKFSLASVRCRPPASRTSALRSRHGKCCFLLRRQRSVFQ